VYILVSFVMKIAALIFLVIIYHFSSGQTDSTKSGFYYEFSDFQKNQPVQYSEVKVKKIRKSEIAEYEITIKGQKKSKELIYRNYGFYFENNILYYNAYRDGFAYGFIKFTSLKTYNFFIGFSEINSKPDDANKYVRVADEIYGDFNTYKAVPGPLKYYSPGIELPTKAFEYYVLNLKTGMVNMLNKEYILLLIKPYNDLKASFPSMEYNVSLKVLLKYLNQVNQREPL
jgi:hypothetical protein